MNSSIACLIGRMGLLSQFGNLKYQKILSLYKSELFTKIKYWCILNSILLNDSLNQTSKNKWGKHLNYFKTVLRKRF